MDYDYYQRDDVTEYLAEQRQRIAELEAENRALRAQLDALCRGEGLAVVINGRQIPLAALAATADAESARAHHAQPHAGQSRGRRPSAPPDLYHHPAQRVPMPSPHTPPAPTEAVFPEDAWLTGSTPAVQASPAAQAQTPQRGRNTGAHALRPSERITPEWLRESRHAAAPAPSQHSRSQPSASYHPHEDAWADSYSQSHFSTLAQITGQTPAARPRRDPDARNPYADSFVLD